MDPQAFRLRELRFVARQEAEHMLFILWGLRPDLKESGEIRRMATDLYAAWLLLLQRAQDAPEITADIYDSAQAAFERTRRLQTTLLDLMASGEWLGWMNFPSFLQHMNEENDYWQIKFARGSPLSQCDEAIFWANHNKEETALVAHLLDPAMLEETMRRLQLSQTWNELLSSLASGGCQPEKVQQVGEATAALIDDNNNLLAGIASGSVWADMPALLGQHENREHEYALQALAESAT